MNISLGWSVPTPTTWMRMPLSEAARASASTTSSASLVSPSPIRTIHLSSSGAPERVESAAASRIATPRSVPGSCALAIVGLTPERRCRITR
jgi:hypothetical protein